MTAIPPRLQAAFLPGFCFQARPGLQVKGQSLGRPSGITVEGFSFYLLLLATVKAIFLHGA